MGAVYLGLSTTYFKASRLFDGFGWLDVIVAGLVGALGLTATTLFLFVQYRTWRTPPVPARDRREFAGEIVNVADLIAYAPIIANKEFARCVIRGLGQIRFQKTTLLFCSVLKRNVVVAAENSNITGAIFIVNCSFIECYFDVAMVGTPQEINDVRSALEFVSLAEWEHRYEKS